MADIPATPVAISRAAAKKNRIQCIGTARTGDQCRRYGIEDTAFCALHAHLRDCTPEQLAAAKLCSGCHVQFYTEDLNIHGEVFRQCIKCRAHGAAARKQAAENAEQNAMYNCEVVGCNLKGMLIEGTVEYDKYCKLHQRKHFIDQTLALGLKLCANHIRGCNAQMQAAYTRTRCENCLCKEREKDHKRRGTPMVVAPAPGVVAGGTPVIVIPENMQRCTTCCKVQQNTEFVSAVGGRTKTCARCRAENKKQDARRDRAHRNEMARKVYAANPDSHEVKKQWALHNRDKIVNIWRSFRVRKRATLGDEAYLRENADAAQTWRNANPALVEAQYQRNKDSREYQYRVYARKARDRETEFTISFDEYVAITAIPCAYCNILPPRGFCGVDRVDNTRGYIAENCVGCCTMCNFMKKDASKETFLNRIEHIVVYQNLVKTGTLHPDDFDDGNGSSYISCATEAERRGKPFDLTEEEFYNEVCDSCYICGKDNTDTNLNGLDRVNNDEGYFVDNVKACCKTCNYMKRTYELDEFFDKCKEIHMANSIKISGDAPMKMGGNEIAPMKMGGNEIAPMKMGGNEIAPMKMGGNEIAPINMNVTEIAPVKKVKTLEEKAEEQREFQLKQRRQMGENAYKSKEAARKKQNRDAERQRTGIQPRVRRTEEERREINRKYNAQKYRAAHPPIDNIVENITIEPVLPIPAITRQTDEERREKNRVYNAAKYAAAHPPRAPQTEEERREKNRAYNAEKYRATHNTDGRNT